MHAQDAESFKHFKACRAYEAAFALKAEGKVRHVGMTFYDRAEVLNQILNDCPQIEVVQIQLNYVDFEDPTVQSRALLRGLPQARQAGYCHETVQGRSPG